MNEDLVKQARRYAAKDEYYVTKRYITELCDEVERLRNINTNVFSKIQDNKEIWADAERYKWLRDSAWNVDFEAVAPIVVNCDNRMEKFEWLEGSKLDTIIDEWRKK